MEIKNHIIRFKQSFNCLTTGFWGVYIREELISKDSTEPLFKKMLCLSKGDQVNHRMTADDRIPNSKKLLFELPLSSFNCKQLPKEGMVFRTAQTFNGDARLAGKITAVGATTITLDCNFPQIGQKNIDTIIEVSDIIEHCEEQCGKFKPTLRLIN